MCRLFLGRAMCSLAWQVVIKNAMYTAAAQVLFERSSQNYKS